MTSYKIICPLRVPVSKNKEFLLNLNTYRNAHFQTLNKAKKNYSGLIIPQLTNIPLILKARMHFTLYPGSNHKMDTSNICSIVEKFVCDTLVAEGKMLDDNYNYLISSSYSFGFVDKNNGRVELVITEIT